MVEPNSFNPLSEQDRTFVMPSPGGAAPGAAANPAGGVASSFPAAEIHSGGNPLLAAANPLINLIYQIRTLVHNAEPARLRDFLVQEIRNFEARARHEGIANETVLTARYCLCTVLDETAAQTPWGASGVWSRNSLLVSFHNETWGGEKFFQLLGRLTQSPRQYCDLLELMYYCISLGFRGRFSIIENGQTQLETLRWRLAEMIREVRGERDKPLSVHWRGVNRKPPAVWKVLPVWVSALGAVLLAALIYMLISFYLADRSDRSFIAINALKLPQTPVVVRSTQPPLRFSHILEPEIRAGLVSVQETPDKSTVSILGDGLFDSGSPSIRPRFNDILRRIAEALDTVNGRVEVVGHSDNVPIRTVRFPSNWHLSMARAENVAEMLKSNIRHTGRVTAQGRGSAEPVMPNDTPAHRALNRRVEVTVFASAADLHREIR